MDKVKSAIAVQEGFDLMVDLSLSFMEMIKLGRYDHVSSGVTEKLFPLQGRYGGFVEGCLVDCGQFSGLSNALKRIDSYGLVPASIDELLAFGHAYPDEQRKYGIAALGSVVQPVGQESKLAPFLYWGREFGRLLGVANCTNMFLGTDRSKSNWWFLAFLR